MNIYEIPVTYTGNMTKRLKQPIHDNLFFLSVIRSMVRVTFGIAAMVLIDRVGGRYTSSSL
jgi:hypothetical protein